MNIIGLDIGKRKSQVCVGDVDGTIVLEKRIDTSRESFDAFFSQYRPGRILLEASNSAEWIARQLEALGLEVIVGDPRFSPMYAQIDRHIKTDKRDARGLMLANRLGAFKRAHRRSDESRDLRARLLVRAGVVKMRVRTATALRAMLESRGIAIGACEVESLGDHVDGVEVEEGFGLAILPMVAQLDQLNETIAELDAELAQASAAHPVASRLDKVVGVGPLTALAFVTAIDDPKRFDNARQVASFFGFVPSEHSTGERQQRRGRSTRIGDRLTRSYLIQAAWSLRRSKKPEVAALKGWASEIERRRGTNIAVHALARRLVRILFALWRDGAHFDAGRFQEPQAQPTANDDASRSTPAEKVG